MLFNKLKRINLKAYMCYNKIKLPEILKFKKACIFFEICKFKKKQFNRYVNPHLRHTLTIINIIQYDPNQKYHYLTDLIFNGNKLLSTKTNWHLHT